MRETTRFTSRITVSFAFMALVGTSAFADSRHPQTTGTRDEARASIVVRDRAAVATPAGEVSPVGRQREESPRIAKPGRSDRGVRGRETEVDRARPEVVNQDRSDRAVRGRALAVNGDRPAAVDLDRSAQVDRTAGEGRGYEQRDRRGSTNGGAQAGRNGNRHSTGAPVNQGKRAPHYSHGQVSKVRPYNHGYRVWIHGSPYPYFVPAAYWRPGYFNVGMTIRVGGYYNTSGYYDYYGDYECNTIAEKQMRGVVEYVDYRRGEMLLDVVGGGEVMVAVRDRFESVRPGDYVVVYGDWNRSGRFVALDVDVIDRDYRW